jgi:signal peptidase I
MITHTHQVKSEIKALQPDNRKTLNLAQAGLAFEIQADPIMNDLFLYSILWNTGVLSGKPLMKRIIAQYFDVIVLRKDQYLRKKLETPYDYLIGTVLTCYELARVGQYCYCTPKHIS